MAMSTLPTVPGGHAGARRPPAQRRELGRFLRAARGRLQPSEVGLVAGARRRAPGLLREEVAQLAAMSCSWYSWLEQGRDIQVSEQVLTSVARALHLTTAERDHLFALAGHPAPDGGSGDGREDAGLRRLVHQLSDAPAYLVDRSWNIVEWNEAATVLFELPLEAVPEPDRNALRLALLGTYLPIRFVDPITTARRQIARFRSETAALIGDPGLESLIDRMLSDSELFRALWPLQEVDTCPAGPLRYRHQTHGGLTFDFISTQGDHSPGLRLHAFLPCR